MSSSPGPGQYESGSKRPLSGAKIGKSERSLISTSFVPSPGAYDYSIFNLKKVYAKIGTGSRYKNDKSVTPGPGAYESYKDSKEGVTISRIKNKKILK